MPTLPAHLSMAEQHQALDSGDSGPQRSPTFQLLRLADPVIHGPRRPQQDYRHYRQAELRKQLAELYAQL
jgi:hypothetical protein